MNGSDSRWEHGSFFHWLSYETAEPTPAPWDGRETLYGAGSQALCALINLGKQAHGWKRLLVPAYFCQGVIEQLKTTGIEITAYADGPEELSSDLHDIQPKAGDVMLRMNYFGLRNSPSPLNVDRSKVVVIDDHSHDPWSHWAWHSDADWCIASLRKTLPLPDGGVLWSPAGHAFPPKPELTEELCQSSLRKLNAMQLKALYLAGYPVKKDSYLKAAVSAENDLNTCAISAITPWSRSLIGTFPVEPWRNTRRRNYAALASVLEDLHDLRVLQPSADIDCPFVGVVVFDSTAKRNQIISRLRFLNIYATVLWPLEETACGGIAEEYINFARRTMAIHCDMRYGQAHMERVAFLIRDAIRGATVEQHENGAWIGSLNH